MKLDKFWIDLKMNFDIMQTRLMDEADAAFYSNDRVCCLDAISQLYKLFDEELG